MDNTNGGGDLTVRDFIEVTTLALAESLVFIDDSHKLADVITAGILLFSFENCSSKDLQGEKVKLDYNTFTKNLMNLYLILTTKVSEYQRRLENTLPRRINTLPMHSRKSIT